MQLVVTIDVEEDQWGWTSCHSTTIRNTKEVPALQQMFDAYHVVPTYLLTFPVASDEGAASLFRDYLEAGRCEIGMHCHPWTTPPYQERLTRHNSMLCNLPPSLQHEKLERLSEVIHRRFGRAPVAFRSGRWGFGCETARILAELGCRIDTSITPYTSWTASDGPDFSSYSPHAFTFFHGDFPAQDPAGDMLEVPVTIGYLGGGFRSCDRLRRTLTRAPFRHLRLAGLLGRLGILRRVWLSPERETPARLARLLRLSMLEGCRIVNLVFHSSSLQAGCTPFVQTSEDKARFLKALRTVLDLCGELGVKSLPLSQAASGDLVTVLEGPRRSDASAAAPSQPSASCRQGI